MPRALSGSYTSSASSFNPSVDGAVIDSSTWNALLADFTTTFTNSWDRTGKGAALATMSMGGFRMRLVGSSISAGDAMSRSASDIRFVKSSSGGQLPATATNDSAGTGKLGEFISKTVLSASATSLATNTAKNITSISLTAGDWDVTGVAAFNPNAATTITLYSAWISTTSATAPTVPNSGAYAQFLFSTAITGVGWVFPVGTIRISVAGTTTVYLSALSTFLTNTNAAYGFISARRRR